MSHDMARVTKLMKFMLHMCSLLFVSYLISKRSYKVVSIKKLDRFLADLKHILIWTKLQEIEDEGQKYFLDNRCKKTNCYFTSNRYLFGDTRYFDAIVFNLKDISRGAYDVPSIRSWNQRFIFAANDSADNHPVCSPVYDDFFNWTWSYRSDSTIIYRFFSIQNIDMEELGFHFKWIKQMSPLDSFAKNQLISKSKAAVVFLDQCESRSKREEFLYKLQSHLLKYDLGIEIFGECGTKKCKRKTMAPCFWRLRRDYFFYMALEDSFDDDYVTAGVVHAYKNNAVPIVYGGAQYEKFLPPGSYINAMQISVEALAKRMHELIKNRDLYHDYFRWKNHYFITETSGLQACALCDMLNDPKFMAHRLTYMDFRKWWNPPHERSCMSTNFLMNML